METPKQTDLAAAKELIENDALLRADDLSRSMLEKGFIVNDQAVDAGEWLDQRKEAILGRPDMKKTLTALDEQMEGQNSKPEDNNL